MPDPATPSSYPPFQIVCDRPSEQVQHLQFQQPTDAERLEWVTWPQAIVLLQQNKAFRTLLTETLAGMPFPAFFWETPPITAESCHQPWECVAVAAPTLAQTTPDPTPFSRYLRGAQPSAITTFPNLSGDALLVVPGEQGDINAYTHLANFLRLAPPAQVHQLWQVLGQTIQQHLINRSGKPLWVSTSGLGVAWLHIRLDDSPKYYTYAPYRQAG